MLWHMTRVDLEKSSNVVKFATQLPIKAHEFKSSKRGSCTLDRLHVWVLVEWTTRKESVKYCLSFRRGRTEPLNSSAPLLTSSSLYCHQKALHSEDAGVEGIFGGFDDPWSGPHLHGKANSVEGGLGAGGGRLLCRGRPDDHQLLHGVEGGACLLHGDQSTHIWPHLSWGDCQATFE